MDNNVICVCFCVLLSGLRIKSELYEGDSCFSEVDGLNGTCVKIRKCLSTVYDIKRRIHPQTCSFKGNNPIVCCTDCDLTSDISMVLVDNEGYYHFKSGSKAADQCLEYTLNLDYPCMARDGLRRELNTKGNCYYYASPFHYTTFLGQNAGRREFPHMALLGYGDSIDNAQWVCGGSVISDRFILTAAHCIASVSLGSVKYVGLGILKRTDPAKTWQLYNVTRIIPHPQYKAPSKYHDIALLETDEKIKFSRDVLPGCLYTGNQGARMASATGWGALGHRKELADNLQVVYLQEFSEDECSKAFPSNRNLQNGYDHASQACYGDKDRPTNTCEGDSGGPLQVTSRLASCVFNIIGVTSFGRACGFLGTPGIYTRVTNYIPWIESVVWP